MLFFSFRLFLNALQSWVDATQRTPPVRVCSSTSRLLLVGCFFSSRLLSGALLLRSIHHKRIRFPHWPSAVLVIRLWWPHKKGAPNEEKQKDNHSRRKESEREEKKKKKKPVSSLWLPGDLWAVGMDPVLSLSLWVYLYILFLFRSRHALLNFVFFSSREPGGCVFSIDPAKTSKRGMDTY